MHQIHLHVKIRFNPSYLDGANLPAVSSAGSDNRGLTATLPIRPHQGFVDADKETGLRAIGLSRYYYRLHQDTGRDFLLFCGLLEQVLQFRQHSFHSRESMLKIPVA